MALSPEIKPILQVYLEKKAKGLAPEHSDGLTVMIRLQDEYMAKARIEVYCPECQYGACAYVGRTTTDCMIMGLEVAAENLHSLPCSLQPAVSPNG